MKSVQVSSIQKCSSDRGLLCMQGTLDVSKMYASDVCQVSVQGNNLLILAAKNGHAHLLSQLVKIENCPLDYRQMEVSPTLPPSHLPSLHSLSLSLSLRSLIFWMSR